MIQDRYRRHVRSATRMLRHLGRSVAGSRAFFVLRDRSDPAQPQIIACHPPLSDDALLKCFGGEHVVCEQVEDDHAHHSYVGLAALAGFDNRELAHEMTVVAAETLATQAASLTTIDAVTGLMDRDTFVALVDERAARGEGSALLIVDIDRVYRVVARVGDAGTDEFLRAVAVRLVEALDDEVVARIGGDKFGVLLRADTGEAAVLALATSLHQALRAPFRVADEDIIITASIGVAIATEPSPATALLHQADVGIALATDAGGAVTRVFRAGANNGPAFALLRERDIRLGVNRGEFTTFFQPIMNTRGGALHAFEALLRWRNPAEGLLPPSTFLDVLQETGLIDMVGRRVIRESCEHAARWHDLSGTLVPVSVNIAPVQLYADDFCDDVARILAETGLPPRGLILELTESAFIEDLARARAALIALGRLGVRVLIDDFGSGYSSLSYLHELPVSGIKLDRQWFRAIETCERQREIVRTIVGLAHYMEMDVVAEGIESAAQLTAARDLHCDFAQGYCFAQALDAEHATRFLARNLARSAAA
jgi:diguanylate cyclase (GGDEF)-like protein